MLSMEPTQLKQSSSRAKATDANRDLDCDPWSIQQSRLPYHTGALASAGVSIYEGVAYCVMSQILTLWASGKTLKFWFPVIRVYYEILGHMLKPIVPKFCLDLWARLKDIAKKQVPAKLKPIVVFSKRWRQNTGIKLLYRILEFLTILQFRKKPSKNFLSNLFRENLWIKKKTEYMWSNTCRWICIQSFKLITSKTAKFCSFEWPKRPFLTLFTRIPATFRFSNFVRFGSFKKFPKVVFLRYWRRYDLETYITPPKPKILSLTFLTSWPWMTRFRKVLRSSPDTINVVPLALF